MKGENTARPPSRTAIVGGLVCLLVGLAASFMLALAHFAVAQPPGCGPGSGCDQATRSVWGRLPLLNWPVSLVGAAYFGAMLAAWVVSRGRLPGALRAVAALGVIASIMFTFIMFRNGYVCRYCLVTHAANIAFAGVALLASSEAVEAARRTRAAVAWAVTFLALTGALAAVNWRTQALREARAEAEREASMAAITKTTTRAAAPTTASAGVDTTPFTGRYRLGPENAPIRIVMFFDYQCSDCRIMESQAMALVRSRQDVSLSVKHFPMNTLCNPSAPDLHKNACWAARAAEAAGMLRGNDGFWQMHEWLFTQSPPGSFTDASLPASLRQMGYDPQQFIATMSGSRTLELLKADIAEAISLGLHFTPMIFINGVELRGFIGNPGALARSVNELAARNPPPGTAARDRPETAIDKYVGDWLAQLQLTIVQRARTWALGPENAPAQFVVWGDYQEPNCAALDRALRQKVAAGGVRYEFRHYPFDRTCNPSLPRTMFPFGCTAAKAVEAAGLLGGNDAYWHMHTWLFEHQTPLDDDALQQAAEAVGIDGPTLLERIKQPDVAAGVQEDIERARPYVQQSIPAVYLNGRRVPRWQLQGHDVLERMIAHIRQEPPQP